MAAPNSALGKVILVPRTFPTENIERRIVERYKQLRLHGLKVDPQSFSSTYDDESQFPDDVWLSRVRNPVARTFAVISDFDTQSDMLTPQKVDQNEIADNALKELLRKEWVGIVTLLGPEVFCRPDDNGKLELSQPYEVFLRNGTYQIRSTASELGDLTGEHLVYLIVGMFISPSARRRGYGQQLMEAAIAAAIAEGHALGARTISITVQVESENLRARRLYERVGFKAVVEELVIENRQGAKSTVVCLEKVVDLTIA